MGPQSTARADLRGCDFCRGAVHRRSHARRVVRHVPPSSCPDRPLMGRPNLFIVGAPKAGTTSLYEYIAGHPQVYMSPFKEPMYFCPDVHPFRERHPFLYGEDEARYLELFDN